MQCEETCYWGAMLQVSLESYLCRTSFFLGPCAIPRQAAMGSTYSPTLLSVSKTPKGGRCGATCLENESRRQPFPDFEISKPKYSFGFSGFSGREVDQQMSKGASGIAVSLGDKTNLEFSLKVLFCFVWDRSHYETLASLQLLLWRPGWPWTHRNSPIQSCN